MRSLELPPAHATHGCRCSRSSSGRQPRHRDEPDEVADEGAAGDQTQQQFGKPELRAHVRQSQPVGVAGHAEGDADHSGSSNTYSDRLLVHITDSQLGVGAARRAGHGASTSVVFGKRSMRARLSSIGGAKRWGRGDYRTVKDRDALRDRPSIARASVLRQPIALERA
jgi:hypothetical protein